MKEISWLDAYKHLESVRIMLLQTDDIAPIGLVESVKLNATLGVVTDFLEQEYRKAHNG